jgi:uncharacterized membrane protein
MNNVIAETAQQTGGRLMMAGHYLRTSWALVNAVVAVVAGLSTLNMAVANSGMATLNQATAPLWQQFRSTRQES